MGHVLESRALIYLLLGCDPFNLAQVRAVTMEINALQDALHTAVLITGVGYCKSSLEILYMRYFVSLKGTGRARLSIC